MGEVYVLYFAYGSNLCERRLRDRVPGAELVDRATLNGFALRWHKQSKDGSGKCSLITSEDELVHGAVFRLPVSEKPKLDRVEGLGYGYDEISVTVLAGTESLVATTYVASRSAIDDRLHPYAWYRDLVITGAESLGLPEPYVDRLRRVPAIADKDKSRARQNRESIPCRGSS